MIHITCALTTRDDGRREVNTEIDAADSDVVYMLANILYAIETNYGPNVIQAAVMISKDPDNKTVLKNEHYPISPGTTSREIM